VNDKDFTSSSAVSQWQKMLKFILM